MKSCFTGFKAHYSNSFSHSTVTRKLWEGCKVGFKLPGNRNINSELRDRSIIRRLQDLVI